MKKIILILLLFISYVGYSQVITPIKTAKKVVIVKDNSAKSLMHTYYAGENRVFWLLDNGEFRIYDTVTKRVYSADSLNNDIKETNYIHIFLDDIKHEIKKE